MPVPATTADRYLSFLEFPPEGGDVRIRVFKRTDPYSERISQDGIAVSPGRISFLTRAAGVGGTHRPRKGLALRECAHETKDGRGVGPGAA
jgi:hypothetical protein